MPVVRMSCRCGHEYDAIDGCTIKDPTIEECPACGSVPNRVFVPNRVTIPSGYDYDSVYRGASQDAILERQMVYENRQKQEELILSGTREMGNLTVQESGPPWTRPFGGDKDKMKEALNVEKLSVLKKEAS